MLDRGNQGTIGYNLICTVVPWMQINNRLPTSSSGQNQLYVHFYNIKGLANGDSLEHQPLEIAELPSSSQRSWRDNTLLVLAAVTNTLPYNRYRGIFGPNSGPFLFSF